MEDSNFSDISFSGIRIKESGEMHLPKFIKRKRQGKKRVLGSRNIDFIDRSRQRPMILLGFKGTVETVETAHLKQINREE